MPRTSKPLTREQYQARQAQAITRLQNARTLVEDAEKVLNTALDERSEAVAEASELDMTRALVAELLGITPSRVQQILDAREKRP